MALMAIDRERLTGRDDGRANLPAADRLYRKGSVFFVGGALPVYETMVTMFDSHCMEATELFFLTFGPEGSLAAGIEMARQIRKNFHVRLMAGIGPVVEPADIGRIYAAGVDNLVFSLAGNFADEEWLPAAMAAARQVFPRGGVGVALPLATANAVTIDRLWGEGIVPLVTWGTDVRANEEAAVALERLIVVWDAAGVAVAPYIPLLTSLAPLIDTRPVGPVRGFIERFRNQRQLAGSALRRHLRLFSADDSLDSAGL